MLVLLTLGRFKSPNIRLSGDFPCQVQRSSLKAERNFDYSKFTSLVQFIWVIFRGMIGVMGIKECCRHETLIRFQVCVSRESNNGDRNGLSIVLVILWGCRPPLSGVERSRCHPFEQCLFFRTFQTTHK